MRTVCVGTGAISLVSAGSGRPPPYVCDTTTARFLCRSSSPAPSTASDASRSGLSLPRTTTRSFPLAMRDDLLAVGLHDVGLVDALLLDVRGRVVDAGNRCGGPLGGSERHRPPNRGRTGRRSSRPAASRGPGSRRSLRSSGGSAWPAGRRMTTRPRASPGPPERTSSVREPSERHGVQPPYVATARVRHSLQKTGVSLQMPQTSRRASHISPIVT